MLNLIETLKLFGRILFSSTYNKAVLSLKITIVQLNDSQSAAWPPKPHRLSSL
jgi:hypothetical protein